MTVKLSGTWKKDEREYNGLEAIVDALVDDPLTRRFIVGSIETKRVTRDIGDGGVDVPTVKVVHIEAMDGEDADAVKELLLKRYRERTGRGGSQDTLPFGEEGDDGPVSERPHDEWLDPNAREE